MVLVLSFCGVAQRAPEMYLAAGHEPLGRIETIFSPDGRLLATHQAEVYGVIKIWDVQTGEELRSIDSPTLSTTEPVFLPDGKKFLWSNEAHSLVMVDVESGTVSGQICPKNTPAARRSSPSAPAAALFR